MVLFVLSALLLIGVCCSSATVMKYLRKRRKGFCLVAEVSEPEVSGPVVAQHSVMGAWRRGILFSSRSQGSKKRKQEGTRVSGSSLQAGSPVSCRNSIPVLSQADDLTNGSLGGQFHHSNSNLAVDTGRLPCKIDILALNPLNKVCYR